MLGQTRLPITLYYYRARTPIYSFTSLVTFGGGVLLPPAGTHTSELLPQVLSPVICVPWVGGSPHL